MEAEGFCRFDVAPRAVPHQQHFICRGFEHVQGGDKGFMRGLFYPHKIVRDHAGKKWEQVCFLKEIMSHDPEFTYRRLLEAAKIAKQLGAQIMGLGAFTKVVGDAGATVARRAPLPITTGNSYSASGALWAAQGHHVKLVSTTSGDVGHWCQAGGPLAQRRLAEAKKNNAL